MLYPSKIVMTTTTTTLASYYYYANNTKFLEKIKKFVLGI